MTGVVRAGYIKVIFILADNQLSEFLHPRVPPRRAQNAATGAGDLAPSQCEGTQLLAPMPCVSSSGRREPAYNRPTLDQAPPPGAQVLNSE